MVVVVVVVVVVVLSIGCRGEILIYFLFFFFVCVYTAHILQKIPDKSKAKKLFKGSAPAGSPLLFFLSFFSFSYFPSFFYMNKKINRARRIWTCFFI